MAPGEKKAQPPPNKKQKTAKVQHSMASGSAQKVTFKVDKPFSGQTKAARAKLEQVEDLGFKWATALNEMDEKGKALLLERVGIVSILQPLASKSTINALTISMIEAARTAEQKSQPTIGKTRRTNVQAYAPKVLADFLPKPKEKGTRSGTVSRDKNVVPDPGVDEAFDTFVKQCAEYVEEKRWTALKFRRNEQWKVFWFFSAWNGYDMLARIQLLLCDAAKAEEKRKKLIDQGQSSMISTTALNYSHGDTESLKNAIRKQNNLLDISHLQQAYLQMLLAQNVEMGYKAYVAAREKDAKEKFKEPEFMNEHDYLHQLYETWKNEELRNNVPATDWSREIQFGNRYRVFSELLCGNPDEYGVLLTLYGLRFPDTGGSARSFLRKKINNQEMHWVEVFVKKHASIMTNITRIYNTWAPIVFNAGYLDRNELSNLNEELNEDESINELITNKPIEEVQLAIPSGAFEIDEEEDAEEKFTDEEGGEDEENDKDEVHPGTPLSTEVAGGGEIE
ncbi:hypothetical protein V8E51_010227 [Hyaloscypha variabilis]